MPAAHASDNGQFSVFPTPTSTASNRPSFVFDIAPGATLSDSVTITNKSDQEATLNVYAADALNTPDGGFTLRRRTDPQSDAGQWIKLPLAQVTLPARTQTIVPFSISAPSDATPGDHVAGIAVETVTGPTQQSGDVAVTTLAAVGTRVYARVNGPAHESLAIAGMSLVTHGGAGSRFGGGVSADLTYTVVNNGNLRLEPRTSASISPLIGGSKSLPSIQLPELLPHGSAVVHQHVDTILPIGRLTASVTVTALSATAHGSVSALVVPWYLIALILTLGAIWYYRRRRARRRDEPPNDPKDERDGPRRSRGKEPVPV